MTIFGRSARAVDCASAPARGARAAGTVRSQDRRVTSEMSHLLASPSGPHSFSQSSHRFAVTRLRCEPVKTAARSRIPTGHQCPNYPFQTSMSTTRRWPERRFPHPPPRGARSGVVHTPLHRSERCVEDLPGSPARTPRALDAALLQNGVDRLVQILPGALAAWAAVVLRCVIRRRRFLGVGREERGPRCAPRARDNHPGGPWPAHQCFVAGSPAGTVPIWDPRWMTAAQCRAALRNFPLCREWIMGG